MRFVRLSCEPMLHAYVSWARSQAPREPSARLLLTWLEPRRGLYKNNQLLRIRFLRKHLLCCSWGRHSYAEAQKNLKNPWKQSSTPYLPVDHMKLWVSRVSNYSRQFSVQSLARFTVSTCARKLFRWADLHRSDRLGPLRAALPSGHLFLSIYLFIRVALPRNISVLNWKTATKRSKSGFPNSAIGNSRNTVLIWCGDAMNIELKAIKQWVIWRALLCHMPTSQMWLFHLVFTLTMNF